MTRRRCEPAPAPPCDDPPAAPRCPGQRFRDECGRAGLPVDELYRVRLCFDLYTGPVVPCRTWEDVVAVIRATTGPVTFDNRHPGFVVYPDPLDNEK